MLYPVPEFLLVLSLIPQMSSTTPAVPKPLSECTLKRVHERYIGSCGPLFQQLPQMTLHAAAQLTSGTWRNDSKPLSIWSGDMTDVGYPNAALELEIYAGGRGVLRTEYGWFPVRDFVKGNTLHFLMDSSHEVPASDLDIEIIETAAKLLATERVWNRKDNRKCFPEATSWSIYCALEKSELEVAGGVHHRRPAAEIVRKIIEARSKGRSYHHALMEYNNDSTTHLDDVQSLFQEARVDMLKAHE